MAHGILGRARCSYKHATMVVCGGNVVAALVMLHSLLSPVYFHRPSMQSWTLQEASNVLQTEAEEKEIRELHAARLKAVPHALIQRVKEIQAESDDEAARDSEAGYARQKVAAELAERLKELKNSNNQSSQQALEEWRKKAQQRAEEKARGGSSEAVKKVEVGWDPVHGAVLEDAEDETAKVKQKDVDLEGANETGKAFAKGCNPEYHTDYDGLAVRWGLTHPTDTAADCCQACHDQARNAKDGEVKCNIWVYCPSEEGCFSPDIYEHKHHECWLKQALEPKLNFKGTYSEEYRSSHPKAPTVVPWVSGVISE